jgi:hypothetical protein
MSATCPHRTYGTGCGFCGIAPELVTKRNRHRMRCEHCGTLVDVPEDWPVDWITCQPCRDWRPDAEVTA